MILNSADLNEVQPPKIKTISRLAVIEAAVAAG